MRKTVLAICEQQRCRSACASTQSDQPLCCSLPRQYYTSSFYIRNVKPLPSSWSWADRFEAYLVGNTEDRFSRDVAQLLTQLTVMILSSRTCLCKQCRPRSDCTVCHSICIFWTRTKRFKFNTLLKTDGTSDTPYGPRQANLCLRAFRHDTF